MVYLSGVLDFISNFIEITGDMVADGIILAAISVISFLVAFGFVGRIFDAIKMYDADLMSGCHWIIRIIVFIVLSSICVGIAKFLTWLCSFKWWVYVIMGVIIISLVILICWLKYRYSKKRYQKNVLMNNTEENAVQPSVFKFEKDICPRCGGKLVKRHGPYGDFYGCENFSLNNCRYTRKNL